MGAEFKGKKALLFYNPNAGNGTFGSHLDLIIERFQAKGMIVIPLRAGKLENVDNFLREMNPMEYRQIIIAGGDGTVNVMIRAMLRNNIDLPIAIFPVGTANDLGVYLDLPYTIEGLINIALGTKYTLADVGMMNDRPFINVAAMGALMDVSQNTPRDMKNTMGMLSYYLRTLQEVPSLKPIPIHLTSEEFTGDLDIYFMVAMNGKGAGGFHRLAPDAEINDGLLDIVIFKAMPLHMFGPLVVDFVQGKHTEKNKNVEYFRTSHLRIESEVNFGTDIDGEEGEPLPITLSVIPKRLRIFTHKSNMRGVIW